MLLKELKAKLMTETTLNFLQLFLFVFNRICLFQDLENINSNTGVNVSISKSAEVLLRWINIL